MPKPNKVTKFVSKVVPHPTKPNTFVTLDADAHEWLLQPENLVLPMSLTLIRMFTPR